jgi:hypothetical protein
MNSERMSRGIVLGEGEGEWVGRGVVESRGGECQNVELILKDLGGVKTDWHSPIYTVDGVPVPINGDRERKRT